MSVQIDGSTGNIIAIKADYSGDVSIGGTLTYEDVTNIDAVGLITARNGIKVDDLGVQVGTGATIDGATNTLTFLTNGSERIRVTSDGKVGINTDMGGAPASLYPFSVYRSTGTGYVYTETAQSGASAGLRAKAGTADFTIFTTQGTGQLAVYDNTNSAERLRIDSSGRLLLGTTTEGHAYAEKLTIADSGNCGLTIRSGTSNYGSIYFSDGTSGASETRGQLEYNHSTDALSIYTAGSSAMRIDSSGRLMLATTTEGHVSADNFTVADSGHCGITIRSGNTSEGAIYFSDGTSGDAEYRGQVLYDHDGDYMRFSTAVSERLRIDSSGRLMLGTTTEGETGADEFTVASSGDCGITIRSGSSDKGKILFSDATSGDGEHDGYIQYEQNNRVLRFGTATAERVRIDSSGRLLIGATSARTNFNNGSASPQIQIENVSNGNQSSIALIHNENFLTDSSALNFAKTRGGTVGDNAALNQAGDRLGAITFQGNDGTEFVQAASIEGFTDASPGNNDMPGRLVFSTTSDGGSSVTERMRITSGGDIKLAMGNFNDTSVDSNSTNDGVYIAKAGTFKLQVARSGGTVMAVNRIGNDGTLINFRQGGIQEGTISVSGSTVTYGGGHLARWSQLEGGAERTEILRGSVLSNLDEMCEWGEEDNEQLNRMKVSDVEGDANVAGVFVRWDDDDDIYTNDFYCAMTGDFVIRITSGVTVQRGNLLMSAGDGTAKPQGDGYIQDKTIAKVTSTTRSVTYSDGSYCVPCVLMAC